MPGPQVAPMNTGGVAPARPQLSCARSSWRVAPPATAARRGSSTSGAAVPSGEAAQLPRHLHSAALAALAASVVTFTPLLPPPEALAVDNAAVGSCVLRKCQAALAGCLADAPCLENLVCLQTCNSAPDETACQIKCGDRFADKAVDVFNTCAVSTEKCVPQRVDEGVFPIPPDCSLDRSFDVSTFQGRWYITAGLNPLFDTFPCQEHYFASPQPGVLYGEINWRIPTSGNDFIPRSTMQRFVQQPDNPAVLFNHGNEYLNYEDDWYILSSKPDEYVFVYYRGQNDAWKGYGGATVYTRTSSLNPDLIPELTKVAESAGLDFSKFQLTDNSCPAKPEPKGLVAEIERDVERAELFAAEELGELEKVVVEPSLKSFGRGFTILEKDLEAGVGGVVKELEAEEAAAAAELRREGAAAAKLIRGFQMEARMGPLGKLVQMLPEPLRQLIAPM